MRMLRHTRRDTRASAYRLECHGNFGIVHMDIVHNVMAYSSYYHMKDADAWQCETQPLARQCHCHEDGKT